MPDDTNVVGTAGDQTAAGDVSVDTSQDQDLGITLDSEDNTDTDQGVVKEGDDEPTDGDQEGEEVKTGDDSEDNAKKVNQEAVQKKINKIHREKKLAEESAATERQKRIAAEEKIAELTKTTLPEVPPPPDVLDPEYAKKAEYREKVIYAHGMQAANLRSAEDQAKAAAANAQEQDLKIVQGMVSTFEATAETLKINKKALTNSQNVVATYIAGKQNLARYILSDPNGPSNVLYLAQDVAELDKISKMDEVVAAAYIATNITPKANKLKPKKKSDAPKPPFTPSGRSHIADDDPRIAGATFE